MRVRGVSARSHTCARREVEAVAAAARDRHDVQPGHRGEGFVVRVDTARRPSRRRPRSRRPGTRRGWPRCRRSWPGSGWSRAARRGGARSSAASERMNSGVPVDGEYSSTRRSSCCSRSRMQAGVSMSGWPMLRCSTRVPRALAASASGASLRIGEAGMSSARRDTPGARGRLEFVRATSSISFFARWTAGCFGVLLDLR